MSVNGENEYEILLHKLSGIAKHSWCEFLVIALDLSGLLINFETVRY